MKRRIALALTFFAIICTMAACSSDSGEIDISALSKQLLESEAFPNGLEQIDEEAGCYLYGIESGESGPVEEAVFYMATGAVADELVLIKAASEEDAVLIKASVEARVEYLKTSFADYNPSEVPQLEGAALKTSGLYVIFVCADNQAAAEAVLKEYF